MNYEGLNDYELVSYVMNNEEATDLLFEKYKPLIYSVANKMYKDNLGLDINDLVSAGMVGFSVALSTYNSHKDNLFFTYAKRCIETRIATLLKGATRKKYHVLNNSLSVEALEEEFNFDFDRMIGDSSINPENIVVDNENLYELITGIKKELTEFENQVFDLKKNGFNYREIASALDTDPKRIDNAIQRIKTKIKNYLEKKDN
ncbi:MAG: sigma-70 family RNA polymerase sigma factor [Bacilli bacterium]|nr:sigma-70 family RNA polymerase sigma factor [Bacilli bacterium]